MRRISALLPIIKLQSIFSLNTILLKRNACLQPKIPRYAKNIERRRNKKPERYEIANICPALDSNSGPVPPFVQRPKQGLVLGIWFRLWILEVSNYSRRFALQALPRHPNWKLAFPFPKVLKREVPGHQPIKTTRLAVIPLNPSRTNLRLRDLEWTGFLQDYGEFGGDTFVRCRIKGFIVLAFISL